MSASVTLTTGREASTQPDSPTGRDDVVLTVVNLDPHGARAGEVYLNLEALGLPGWVDASRPPSPRVGRG